MRDFLKAKNTFPLYPWHCVARIRVKTFRFYIGQGRAPLYSLLFRHRIYDQKICSYVSLLIYCRSWSFISRFVLTTYPLSSKLYTLWVLFPMFFIKELKFFYNSIGISLKIGDNNAFTVGKLISVKLTTSSLK